MLPTSPSAQARLSSAHGSQLISTISRQASLLSFFFNVHSCFSSPSSSAVTVPLSGCLAIVSAQPTPTATLFPSFSRPLNCSALLHAARAPCSALPAAAASTPLSASASPAIAAAKPCRRSALHNSGLVQAAVTASLSCRAAMLFHSCHLLSVSIVAVGFIGPGLSARPATVVVNWFRFLLQISNSATSAHFPSLGLQPAQLLSLFSSAPLSAQLRRPLLLPPATIAASTAAVVGRALPASVHVISCRRRSFSKLGFRSWSTSLATATARYIQFAPTLFISSCVAWLHLSAICLLFTTASYVIF